MHVCLARDRTHNSSLVSNCHVHRNKQNSWDAQQVSSSKEGRDFVFAIFSIDVSNKGTTHVGLLSFARSTVNTKLSIIL